MKLKLIKSKVGITIVALFCILKSSSQCVEYRNKILSIGYGLPLMEFNSFSEGTLKEDYFDKNYKSNIIGPVNIKYEKFISSNFSVGMNAGLQNVNVKYSYLYYLDSPMVYHYVKFNFYQFHFLLRFNSHFFVNEKVDAYWGLGLGFKTYNYRFWNDFNILAGEAFLGFRYRYNKNCLLYLEAGFGRSNIQAGLSFKL